jgi:hypothetical protein
MSFTLQAERKAAIAKAEEEARLLVQLAEIEGGDYDPADDFPAESQPLEVRFFQACHPASDRPEPANWPHPRHPEPATRLPSARAAPPRKPETNRKTGGDYPKLRRCTGS